MYGRASKNGFTIVELLIVIVVVSILTAISVVTYNGVKDKAVYVRSLSNLTSIEKSLETYHAKNGEYPVTTSSPGTAGGRYSCSYAANDFIPNLTTVVNSVPAAPCTDASNANDTWWYNSDGAGYKLIYVRASVTDGVRNMVPADMRDPVRWAAGTTWGFWTENWRNI